VTDAQEAGPVRQVLAEVARLPEIRTLISALAPGSAQMAYGLGGSARTLLSAAVHRAQGRPSVYVAADLEAARRVETDLVTWLGDDEVVLFPARDLSPIGVLAQSGEIQAQRLRVLESLLAGEPVMVIAPVEAVTGLVPPPERLAATSFTVHEGERRQPRELAATLAAAGYERVPLVERPGDFCLRGGIVDVFPPARDELYRIEFFGDEIGSIRLFSAATQKSTVRTGSARIGPAREWALSSEGADKLASALARELAGAARALKKAGRPQAAERLRQKVEADITTLEAGITPEDLDAYIRLIAPSASVILDFLGPGAAVFLDEPARLEQAAAHLEKERAERAATLLESGTILPSQAETALDYKTAARRAGRAAVIYLTRLLRRAPTRELGGIANLRYQTIPSFQGRWDDFLTELRRWRRSGDRVLVLASSVDRGKALRRSLKEADVVPASRFSEGPSPGQVVVDQGALEEGFYLPGARLRVMTDSQIRGRPARRTRRRAAAPAEGTVRVLTSYRDLQVGDYVVHVNHGIGVYVGIRSLEIEGVTRDYIFIKYAGGDRLYVPTEQVGLIQKYAGVEGREPKIHRLAGTEWSRTKNKAKASLQKLAIDLVKLYAQRQTQPGHGFSSDTPWQDEFEAGFRYEETPDQLVAAREIKQDMEKPTPMDRLLCGDVGYGKTEVAVRAAFKAVMDGKQVAVLVPTTVLAQQHYHTFRERLSGYPVNVDLLSRFRSRARQKKTIRELKLGTVDIVVGTHRLLGEDVVFKDLGLLIVDEEHRFGVGHKERLKALRTSVDVLVLTATPIPRTLNMALVGLRDMSVIDTPPEDRYPVQTYVIEYDEDLVRDAVHRELARNGQVFYVHNRVETIDSTAVKLQTMLPDARIAVAHGQMKEDDLEKVMMDFLDRHYDILVSTTIIESGLDLPNVNTLIVEDADKLGLAQLYQLRGRVGRSNRVAYAYFTYRRGKVVSEVAEKRLEAIRDFTELGSGYKIALRDLEIRGAGNMLGPEQHGFIASVGFELYCRMLEETVRELKGEPDVRKVETTVDVSVDAYLPDDYIPDPRQKIETYQKIAAVDDLEEADELEEELADRYGPLPPPVRNLILVARVRTVAGRLDVTSVSAGPGGGLAVRFDRPTPAVRDALSGLAGRFRGVSVRLSRAALLEYRPGRRPNLGEGRRDRGKKYLELLRGLLDILVDLDRRVRPEREKAAGP